MSQTVKRAIEVIDLIGDSPYSLAELARHFQVHRSTIFRTVQTLTQAGYLLHRTDGSYTVGPRLISLGQRALDEMDLRRIARDELLALHRRVGGTLHLAQLLDDDSIIYVDKVEPIDGVRMYSHIGRPVLPHCSGVGKVILAQLDQSRRDAILQRTQWKAYTKTTHVSRESLDAELTMISHQGWGVDDGEYEDFVNCVAVPISNSVGTHVGALSVTTINSVRSLDDLKDHLADLLKTARTISLQMG